MGVFQYLNHANIQLRMRRQNQQMVQILLSFSVPYMNQVEADTGTRPADPHLDQHWQNFMNQHYERMVARSRADLENRIGQLTTLWNNRAVELLNSYLQEGTAGDATSNIQEAFSVIALLDELWNRIDTIVTVPADFWSDGDGDGDSDDPDSDDPNDPDWDPDDGSDGDSDGSDP